MKKAFLFLPAAALLALSCATAPPAAPEDLPEPPGALNGSEPYGAGEDYPADLGEAAFGAEPEAAREIAPDAPLLAMPGGFFDGAVPAHAEPIALDPGCEPEIPEVVIAEAPPEQGYPAAALAELSPPVFEAPPEPAAAAPVPIAAVPAPAPVQPPAPAPQPVAAQPLPAQPPAANAELAEDAAFAEDAALAEALPDAPLPAEEAPAAAAAPPAFAPGMPELPRPVPDFRSLFPPPPVFSRAVYAAPGQAVEVPFRGNGWVFLGEAGGRRGISFDARRADADGQTFVFRAEAPGEYALRFFRHDFARDFILNDHVRVVVAEGAEGAAPALPGAPFRAGRVSAERWPSAADEARIFRAGGRALPGAAAADGAASEGLAPPAPDPAEALPAPAAPLAAVAEAPPAAPAAPAPVAALPPAEPPPAAPAAPAPVAALPPAGPPPAAPAALAPIAALPPAEPPPAAPAAPAPIAALPPAGPPPAAPAPVAALPPAEPPPPAPAAPASVAALPPAEPPPVAPAAPLPAAPPQAALAPAGAAGFPAQPAAAAPELGGAGDWLFGSPFELLRMASEEFEAGRDREALALLDAFRMLYPSGSDEAWWLLGQFYESDSPDRNMLLALSYYRRLVSEFPQSSRLADARRRIAFIERFFLNIR